MRRLTILTLAGCITLTLTQPARACGYGPRIPDRNHGLAWAVDSEISPAAFMKDNRVMLGFFRQIKTDRHGWTGHLSRARRNDGFRAWVAPSTIRIARPAGWPANRALASPIRSGNLVLLVANEGKLDYRLIAYTAAKKGFGGQWFASTISKLYSPWDWRPLLRTNRYKHTLTELRRGLETAEGADLDRRLNTLRIIGPDARPALDALLQLLRPDKLDWRKQYTILQVLLEIDDRSPATLRRVEAMTHASQRYVTPMARNVLERLSNPAKK